MVKADTGSTTLDRLETSRARLDRKRALRGSAWAALGAVLVFGLLRIAERLGIPFALADSIVSSLALSLGVLLAGVAGVLAHIHRRQATLATAARMADLRFDLDERLGTALECGLATGASSDQPVVRALLADAAARSAGVDPVALVPLRVPRPAWHALALALAFAALEMVPGGPGLPTTSTAASPPALAPSSAPRILETAALLREEAARQSDEYLWVVAEAMEKLAGELVAERMTGEEAAGELSRLLDHADRATQTAAATAESAESTGSDPSQQPARPESEGEPVPPPGGEERAQNEPSAVEAAETTSPSEELQTALQDLRSELSNPPPDRERAERLATSTDAPPEPEVDTQAPQPGSQDSIAPGQLASMRLGPRGEGARENELASPQDGAGSSPFRTGTPEIGEIPNTPPTQDFELPSNPEAGGARRRVSDEITPETRLTTVAETALREGTWRKVQEAHVSSEPLGITYREVATRYFLYLAQQAEARAESQ
jgi:hypothetical protein